MLPVEPERGIEDEPESGCGDPPARGAYVVTRVEDRGTVTEPAPLGGGEVQRAPWGSNVSERLRDINGTGGVVNLGPIGGVATSIGAATMLPPGDPTET